MFNGNMNVTLESHDPPFKRGSLARAITSESSERVFYEDLQKCASGAFVGPGRKGAFSLHGVTCRN